MRRYAERRRGRGRVARFRARIPKVVVLVALCSLAAREGRSQERPAGDDGRLSAYDRALLQFRPAARARIADADTARTLRSRSVAEGRVDLETGVFRARYRIGDQVAPGLPAAQAALAYLEEHGAAYGIADAAEHLRVEHVREGRFARHVRFRQTLAGVPAHRADVTVSLDRRGQPTMVVSGYIPRLEQARGFDPVPALSAAAAQDVARRAADPELTVSEPELLVYASDAPRLVWSVPAVSAGAPVSWRVLVDARTGEIHRMFNTSLHARKASSASPGFDRAPRRAASAFASASAPAAGFAPSPVVRTPSPPPPPFAVSPPVSGRGTRTVDGTGLVFDPDPLTSAGAEYGGDYRDGDDADAAALTGQLAQAILRDITQGADGLHRLDGPHVRIEGAPHTVPAPPSPDGFDFTRSDDRFEAVNAYYHIDKSRRYAQSLDVGDTLPNFPIKAYPQAFEDDNSVYLPHDRSLRFGTGGVDDAEDADVLWHEYAHALLDYAAPGLSGSFEGAALHEGWADYWAASYSRFLSEEDPRIPRHEWKRLYNWDGNASCWSGRTLDHAGRYDDDMAYEVSGCQFLPDIYQWGLLWATTLMDIYPQTGRAVLDRLHLASHAYLASSSGFRDAAEALIQADRDIYDGAHVGALVQELGEAGYVDPGAYGPILAHDPLGATENTGGTAEVRVEARGAADPVDEVFAHYRTDPAGPFLRVALSRRGGALFAGDLPLPDTPGSVEYYILAVDAQGRSRALPALAPLATYAFVVEEDTAAPSIEHEALLRAPAFAWPVALHAQARDNLGVDSVWVEYIRRGADGAREEGAFGLTRRDGIYSGRFPEPTTPVLIGDVIDYRIAARDASRAGNEARLPAEGFFSLSLALEGELYAFDFERDDPGITAQGWDRGPPAFGLRVAHSGESAWATAPGGAYPSGAGRATLDLPPFNLAEVDSAYLIFWHWYDFERGGVGGSPGTFDERADIRDGGNVKASTDGGASWRTLAPEGGYTGRIGGATGNPLAGQPGFGGYSYGWRREIVALPVSGEVRVRFEAGTDEGNSGEARYFAGWYVDNVSLDTERPRDVEPPRAEGLPRERIVRVVGRDAPAPLSIRAYDDTGIEAVISRYEIMDRSGLATGSMRLAMSGVDANAYEGYAAPPRPFAPGDRVAYTLLVRDFDGNETAYGPPFAIDFRSEAHVPAEPAAVVPVGVWRRAGGEWLARGGASTARPGAVSSLVFEPVTIPANSESAALEFAHAYALGENFGGNVKISEDDGFAWSVLHPEGGYDRDYAPAVDHPMKGEPVFGGDSEGSGNAPFDLTRHAGETVRLRIDLAHAEAFGSDTVWRIGNIAYRFLSPDDAAEIPYELALHANFPDPARGVTHVSYTVPGDETTPVRLSAYDVTGRRVAVIHDRPQAPGTYTARFDAGRLASGVYMLRLETPRGVRLERMVVIR